MFRSAINSNLNLLFQGSKHLNLNLPVLANTLRLEFKRNTGLEEPLIQELKQPTEWEDIPEYEGVEGEEEFLEGF